jgi:hypothetical protein
MQQSSCGMSDVLLPRDAFAIGFAGPLGTGHLAIQQSKQSSHGSSGFRPQGRPDRANLVDRRMVNKRLLLVQDSTSGLS